MLSKQVALELKADKEFQEFMMVCIHKFMNKDWGDMPDDDKEANEKASVLGDEICAFYRMKLKPANDLAMIIGKDRKFLQIIFDFELCQGVPSKGLIYGLNGKPLS